MMSPGSHLLASSEGPRPGDEGVAWVCVCVFRSPPGYRVPRATRPGDTRKAPGAQGAREELPAEPEEGCPSESCQGNLSNSSTGASLLHNSQAAAGGRRGRSPAPAGSPHPY